MRRPPPINPRDASSDLYDSCVDNWMDPQIFVIFNDDQSYPYFIIHYEEVPSTVAIWALDCKTMSVFVYLQTLNHSLYRS